MRTNVVLIGMPGAGKSTVGVVLAKRLGLQFIDVDLLIQMRTGQRLQEIINRHGLAAFCRIEEEVLLDLRAANAVIATGGSAVYSEKAMAALKGEGTVVFLDLPLEELQRRLKDMDSRGLVIDPGQTLTDLWRQRLPLYRRHAELTVDGRGKSVEEMAAEITLRLAALDFKPTSGG